MKELLPYMIIDFTVVMAVGLFYLRRSSFFHPLSFYLFFHLYSFTLRAIELYNGKFPMYFSALSSNYYNAIRPEEFIRAMIIADVALFLFAAGCFTAGSRIYRRIPRPFDQNLLIALLFALLPVSSWLLITRRFAEPGQAEFDFQLLVLMGVWPIACIGLAMARWGFKLYWLALAVVYMALVGTQGYHRFMALLPVILLVGIYLARQRRRWPGPGVWALLVAIALIFPVMKDFGREFNRSGTSAAIEKVTADSPIANDPRATRTEQFLDQFASALTLADGLEAPLLGRTYLAIVTLPVPRSWWPNKPSLGESAIAISAPGRPLIEEGRIVTLLGESYINFGYVGVALVLPLLGFLLARFYLKAFAVPELDSYKLAYIALTTTYLQVFRDGILSLILFSIIVGFPIYLYAFLNSQLQRIAEGRPRPPTPRGVGVGLPSPVNARRRQSESST